jgi:hypothetical protein
LVWLIRRVPGTGLVKFSRNFRRPHIACPQQRGRHTAPLVEPLPALAGRKIPDANAARLQGLTSSIQADPAQCSYQAMAELVIMRNLDHLIREPRRGALPSNVNGRKRC